MNQSKADELFVDMLAFLRRSLSWYCLQVLMIDGMTGAIFIVNCHNVRTYVPTTAHIKQWANARKVQNAYLDSSGP